MITRITALKRSSFDSRRPAKRKLENEARKSQKLQKLSAVDLENNFKQKSLFGNFQKCIGCGCNLANANEINKQSESVTEGIYNLDEKLEYKRLTKFWVCEFCRNGQFNGNFPIPNVKVSLINTDDSLLYVPCVQNKTFDSIHGFEDNQDNVKFVFPCSTDALNMIDRNLSLSSLGANFIQLLFYGDIRMNQDHVGLLYENQLLKYKNALKYSQIYSGMIVDEQSKVLSNIKKVSTESRIVGSDAYRKARNLEDECRIHQLGSCVMKFTMKFRYDDQQTLATHLIQEGHILSVSLEGEISREQRICYYVHKGNI